MVKTHIICDIPTNICKKMMENEDIKCRKWLILTKYKNGHYTENSVKATTKLSTNVCWHWIMISERWISNSRWGELFIIKSVKITK